jgi:hypothetical protein
MASEYLLNPLISAIPLNSNVGFNNSWISVQNPFNIPFFAQLTYVTNLDDIVLEVDDLEELVYRSNTLLDVLTAFSSQQVTLLDKLTSIVQTEFDETQLLLQTEFDQTQTLLDT